jgi:hypothetical protein
VISLDTHELDALAVDLGKLGAEAVKRLTPVFVEGGEQLVKTWAENARATAGQHGKHYPNSIDMDLAVSTDIVVEVGPNPNKKQGRMSFEFGSVNQPPHLDGQRAADAEIPRIERRIQAALAYLDL